MLQKYSTTHNSPISSIIYLLLVCNTFSFFVSFFLFLYFSICWSRKWSSLTCLFFAVHVWLLVGRGRKSNDREIEIKVTDSNCEDPCVWWRVRNGGKGGEVGVRKEGKGLWLLFAAFVNGVHKWAFVCCVFLADGGYLFLFLCVYLFHHFLQLL